jgi:hypothetical protein
MTNAFLVLDSGRMQANKQSVDVVAQLITAGAFGSDFLPTGTHTQIAGERRETRGLRVPTNMRLTLGRSAGFFWQQPPKE